MASFIKFKDFVLRVNDYHLNFKAIESDVRNPQPQIDVELDHRPGHPFEAFSILTNFVEATAFFIPSEPIVSEIIEEIKIETSIESPITFDVFSEAKAELALYSKFYFPTLLELSGKAKASIELLGEINNGIFFSIGRKRIPMELNVDVFAMGFPYIAEFTIMPIDNRFQMTSKMVISPSLPIPQQNIIPIKKFLCSSSLISASPFALPQVNSVQKKITSAILTNASPDDRLKPTINNNSKVTAKLLSGQPTLVKAISSAKVVVSGTAEAVIELLYLAKLEFYDEKYLYEMNDYKIEQLFYTEILPI